MMRPNDTTHHQTLSLGSDPELRRRFMVMDEPLQGNLRFGLLLEILDKVAEETALAYVNRYHPDARVVTAAIDDIFIRHVADVTRDITFHACINHVGRTSLVIGIRVEQTGDPVNHIASCHFTMVARSGNGDQACSVALPPLEYLDALEQKRAAKALASREEYKRQQALLSEPPSRDEYKMLEILHHVQDESVLTGRQRDQSEMHFSGYKASRLVTDSWERMYPEKENVPRSIFGGYLIRRAFELASICSGLIAPNRPIIAAVTRIDFFQPVRIGDTLHFTARVIYTSGSFICVEARIERTSLDHTTRALSNSCFFTFVNVDSTLVHQPVPPIYPATYAEDARYLAAHRSLRELVGHHAII
ncbi:MAG: acyl-CoA thioesterase [Desulfuromonadaceae bacterium]|nr:acyl-CoA thioesterase [Desulfuromonadaceae bacterium]